MTKPRHMKHGVTDREQQMIDLQDAGKKYAEIAAIMGISEKAIAGRLQNLSTHDTGADKAFFRKGREGTTDLGKAILQAGGHR